MISEQNCLLRIEMKEQLLDICCSCCRKQKKPRFTTKKKTRFTQVQNQGMCFDAILANTLRHLLYTPNTLQNSQSPHRQHFEQLVSHRSRRFKSIWDLGTPGICGHNTGIWGLGSGISGIRRAPGREMGFAGSGRAVPVHGIASSRKISIL